MAIHVLDSDLINKIAAGEVIERPSSVVKELIENSLDSGATSILIEIIEGGKSLIKITDNGSGMGPRDIELSVQRHATSKLKTSEDLFKINTLGFRGEALASIAAVSNLKITSRSNEFLHGNHIEVEDGKIKLKKEVGITVGTTIEVTDLFYNTPVRKKYLDKITTESTKIIDLVTRYSLIHPEVYFRLVHNGKLSLNSPSTRDTLANILNIYGKDVVKQLIPINFKRGDITVQGFTSKPSLTRADKTHQSFYVNGRYISNQTIQSALHDSYGTLLFSHRFPISILSLNISPEEVDVNVHPTKKEIRFRNKKEIYEIIFEAIKQALTYAQHIPKVQIIGKDVQTRFAETMNTKEPIAEKNYSVDSNQQSVLAPITEIVDDEILPSLNILGLVHNCYILAENEEGFMIVDQHAAEERVNYEQLLKQYDNNYIKSQQLVIPTHIELSPSDSEILRSNLNLLPKFGFDVEDFGNTTFLVRSTPVVMGRQMSKGTLLDMVDELNAAKVNKFEEIKDKIIARMACRKSIKQGDRIEKGYMQKLLQKLYLCENPFTCPHGRPTMITITKSELEKKFKRI